MVDSSSPSLEGKALKPVSGHKVRVGGCVIASKTKGVTAIYLKTNGSGNLSAELS